MQDMTGSNQKTKTNRVAKSVRVRQLAIANLILRRHAASKADVGV